MTAVTKGSRSARLDISAFLVFLIFFSFYVSLAWLAFGGDKWWVIDYVDFQNVFHGDDAYRFFLARSAWVNPDLYTYNFVLPGQLILDGAITWLVQGDLLFARCFHAGLGAGSLCLIYLAGLELKIPRHVILLAVIILGLIPRYALMSLSFYGEIWLGFLLCLTLWLYLKGHTFLVATVAGWLPLFRPEGIFFLAPLFLQMLFERRFRECFLILLPGCVYFLYLYSALPSLTDYNYWRLELRRILKKVDPSLSAFNVISSYSFLFLLPAFLGAFCSLSTRIWPMILGATLWMIFFLSSAFFGSASIENRYGYILLPFLAILWATFFFRFSVWFSVFYPGWRRRGIGKILLSLIAVIIVSTHFLRTDNVEQEVRLNGYPSFFEKSWQGRWDELYGYYPRESLVARKRIVQVVERLLENDKGIDKIAIGTVETFYDLDPYKIPQEVTVGFLTNNYMTFHKLLDGQTFIQHPGGNMYTYLNYGEPDFRPTEKRAIVISPMPLSDYPYTWIRGANQLYIFSYLESWSPQTNLDEKPSLTPKKGENVD